MYIMASSLVFLCDSRLCELVGLFLVYSLDHFSSHLFILSNSHVLDFLLSYYFVIFYYCPLVACLFSNDRKKESESRYRVVGEELEAIEGDIEKEFHTCIYLILVIFSPPPLSSQVPPNPTQSLLYSNFSSSFLPFL